MPLLSISRRHARPDSVTAVIEGYERAGGGSPSRLAAYWGTVGGGQPVSALAALAKREIQDRFSRGERPAALEYLDRLPDLAARGDLVVSLVYEEFCLLEEGGAAPSVGQFCERYQRWSDSVASQLGYHRQLSQVAGVEPGRGAYPKVGERFAKFTLQEVLGRGGAAQVFRAVQDLGKREVVLKLSRTMGLEPSILAALNHDNIMKIHDEVLSDESGLGGISMPYYPGVTLDVVVGALFGPADAPRKAPRRARALWLACGLRDLDKASAAKYWGGFPHRGTYTEALAWLGLVMAGALEYAHSRGVFHRDIKPANILIARREGPFLFDFNLAHLHSDAERAQDAMSGGTLPYMAPEQLRAFIDPALWDAVQGPADIYALGLVLRELATGRRPPLPPQGLSLPRAIQALLDGRTELAESVRRDHPEVPPALDAIIRKCLAAQVGDRYASAAQLAEDLRLFLARRPLRHAGNPSLLERALNWAYRHRKPAGLLAAGLLAGLLMLPGRADRDPRFVQGRAALESQNPAELRKARDLFDQVALDYPRSAWPLVYKAFAQDLVERAEQGRAGRELSRKTFDLIATALDKEDGVAAVESWRATPETASSIRYMIGNYYINQGNFDRAVAYFNRVIATDPEDPSSYCGLGDVARKQSRDVDAARWYEMGLARLTAPKTVPNPQTVQRLCKVLIAIELKLADRALDGRPEGVDWPLVRSRLDAAGQHLALAGRHDGPLAGRTPLDAIQRDRARGDLASAWGCYSARARRDEVAAVAHFRAASRHYAEAADACRKAFQDAKKLDQELLPIQERQRKLAARRGSLGLVEEPGAARPPEVPAPGPAVPRGNSLSEP